jgi:hypothetical protein
VLNLALEDSSQDASVESFYQAKNALCLHRKTPYLCVVSADITVTGVIVASDSGPLNIRLQKVASYAFADER